jgi:flagellar hook-length control protein FliK
MDSSIAEVTLKGSSGDQPAGQGLSSIKKRGKGNGIPAGLAALIGGPGSFANLLIKIGDGEKEGAAILKMESAAGNNKAEKDSSVGMNGGPEAFLLKRAMGHAGMEAVALGTEILSGKNAETVSVLQAMGDVSEAKTKGKWNPEMSGKAGIVQGEEISGEDDGANSQKGSSVQQGDALRSASVSEVGKKVLLKQKLAGSGNAEQLSSVDAKLPDGEAGSESVALSTDALKENGITRMSGIDDHKYRRSQDLPKGSDVKGSSVSKVSPDPKEMLSIKEGAQYSADVVKDKVTSVLQIQTEGEKAENLRNLAAAGLKSERPLPNGADEIQAGKTGPSPSTAQTDFSMVNGIWSDVRTTVNDKIAAPAVFREIAGQIIDGASNMLMKGSSRIVITLEPPNLGTLNMDVRVQHDMVRMVLVADNNDVKQVLHANLDQLKTALQGQGLNIDRFDVLVHERSFDGNQGFHPGGGALFDGGRDKRSDTTSDGLTPQTLPSGGNEINEPSLGIISLFV